MALHSQAARTDGTKPMNPDSRTPRQITAALVLAVLMAACDNPQPDAARKAGSPSEVSRLGTHEVTARLLEVPEGAVFERDLYDYATILKYQVTASHRGEMTNGSIIFVGHYNPWKPRAEAADARAPGIGGTVRAFHAGDLHRMALQTSIDEHFMGGIVDKYFGQHRGPAYWAVWTDAAR